MAFRLSRSKPVGWRGESYRHYLAAKGYSSRYFAKGNRLPSYYHEGFAGKGRPGDPDYRPSKTRAEIEAELVLAGREDLVVREPKKASFYDRISRTAELPVSTYAPPPPPMPAPPEPPVESEPILEGSAEPEKVVELPGMTAMTPGVPERAPAFAYMAKKRRYNAGMRPDVVLVGDKLMIVPNPIFSDRAKEIRLTPEEIQSFKEWQSGKNVQDAFPSWSPAKRELLLTGMDDDEFNRYVGPER